MNGSVQIRMTHIRPLQLVACLIAVRGIAAHHPQSIAHLFQAKVRHHCGPGTWQRQYNALHEAVLSGTFPTRYALSVAVEAGLADRITGTISIFYYALLSKRALQLTTYDSLPAFEAIFHPAGINWTANDVDPAIIEPLKYTYQGVRGNAAPRLYPNTINTSAYWPVYAVNKVEVLDRLLLHGRVDEQPAGHANVSTIVLAANRGRTWRLFDSPYHREWLLNSGLRPDTGMACAFHYLFKPRPEVEQLMLDKYGTMLDHSILKIGIQIRVGDRSFQGNDLVAWNVVEPYFHCAAQIEMTRARAGQRVVFIFISDSLSLRHQVKARYGNKVVVDTETQPEHTDCFQHHGTCTKLRMARAMRNAVADLLAFSMADYHVYTAAATGFGRLGAGLSFGWHHHYRIAGGRRLCGVNDYDDLRVDSAFRI